MPNYTSSPIGFGITGGLFRLWYYYATSTFTRCYCVTQHRYCVIARHTYLEHGRQFKGVQHGYYEPFGEHHGDGNG